MSMQGSVISYPISLYQNLPIDAQFYQPSRFVISDVTLGQTTIVTTNVNHNYVIGQTVRLLIPPNFGCFQLNEMQGNVLSIPAPNQVVVSINSLRNVDPFVAGTNKIVQPQILAIGDINQGQTNSSGRNNNLVYIPGSFINISPE